MLVDKQPKEFRIDSLVVILVLFFIAKLPHICTPLFHDELGVYGGALFYMLDNGISMLPGDIDPELSRGHPLFFTFFIAIGTKLLGGSYVATRLIILLIAVATLVATYFLGREIGGQKVGIWATIILAIQPLFFAQSIMILPEVMLALLGVMSMLFYLRKQYACYFLMASLLLLTKETGIVILAGIGLHVWRENQYKINLDLLKNGCLWMAPFLSFVLFLVIQKQQNGWYFFPYHTEIMSSSFSLIWKRLDLAIFILFKHQAKFILVIAVLFSLWKLSKVERKELFGNIFILLSVVLAMFVFSSFNFIMARYFVLILPVFIIAVTIIIEKRFLKWQYGLFLFLMTLPHHYEYQKFSDDCNMGYTITTSNTKKVVSTLDEITQGEKSVVLAVFPEKDALLDTRSGYTNNSNYIVVEEFDETVDYILKGSNDHFEMGKHFNDVNYSSQNKVDSIIKQLADEDRIELLLESIHYFNNQRLYKIKN